MYLFITYVFIYTFYIKYNKYGYNYGHNKIYSMYIKCINEYIYLYNLIDMTFSPNLWLAF